MIRRSVLMILALVPMPARAGLDPPAWTTAIAPFHVVGPIDYVGTQGLAAYLIRTRAGAILIDGTLAENAPLIRRNIEALGVPIRSVKLILLTHAHFDHAGALAALKAASGAQLVAGVDDVPALESGMPPGETSYPAVPFPPVQVDRGVRDGAVVTLGDVRLIAHATPGHTPGCTSWSTTVRQAGKPLRVLFPCSITVAGNRLVGNRRYPTIVADFRLSFARLARLEADVVLPAHPELADVLGRSAHGTLVDPTLLPAFVETARAAFEAELARQRAANDSSRDGSGSP